MIFCIFYQVNLTGSGLFKYEHAHQTKLTIGKWSSLLIFQQQLSHDQNKVKTGNILKLIINEF